MIFASVSQSCSTSWWFADFSSSELWSVLTEGASALSLALLGVLLLYLRKKVENLASRQDVAAITREVEQVKAEFAENLEFYKQQLELRRQLQVAALEERLKRYQEAVTLCFRFPSYAHDQTQMARFSSECTRWFESNCAYLSKEAVRIFLNALSAAEQHHILVERWRNARENSREEENRAQEVKENWKKIQEAPWQLLSEVGLHAPGESLPPVTKSRLDAFGREKPSELRS